MPLQLAINEDLRTIYQVNQSVTGKDESLDQFTVHRQMTISHAEFIRTLPAVIKHQPYKTEGGEIYISTPGRNIVIRLEPEQQRQIGSLRLPTTLVHITFIGYTHSEREHFLRRFTISYQRGGG